MQIPKVNSYSYSFTSGSSAKKKSDPNYNPISKAGEKATLAKATFIAGLGLGVKLLFELMDGDFIFDGLGEAAEKIGKKHKNVSQNKKALLTVGAFSGLVLMFIGGFAALYTLFKAPKINYEGNINAFKHQKDMDVYIKGNNAEKEILTQMNEKAQNATEDEKTKLREQYIQMSAAKNQLPEFLNKIK